MKKILLSHALGGACLSFAWSHGIPAIRTLWGRESKGINYFPNAANRSGKHSNFASFLLRIGLIGFLTFLISEKTWSQSQSPFAILTYLQHVCDGQLGAVTFELNGDPSYYDWYWQHGPTDLHLENLQPGIYTLVVINEFGCVEEFPVEILRLENCTMTYTIKPSGYNPCYVNIVIEVFSNGAPVPESSLDVTWLDGDPSGLVRTVSLAYSGVYCVEINPNDGSAGPSLCCYLEECIPITGNPKCSGINTKQVIVNEFARGAQGEGQFTELLVIGSGECNDTFDLRGFIVDDNNGYLIPGNSFVNQYNLSGIGINPGYLIFKDHPAWSNVRVGSLIVILPRDSSQMGIMPAEDPTDADSNFVHVVYADNTDFLSARSGTWNNSDKLLKYDGYLLMPSWNLVEANAGADGMQVRYPDGYFSHGISLGETAFSAENDFMLWLGDNYQTAYDCRFTGTDYLDKTHFQYGTENNTPTPGAPNSEGNEALLNLLRECLGERSSGNASSEKQEQKTLHDNTLHVYPNPFDNDFTLDFKSSLAGKATAVIYSVSGQTLFRETWGCEKGVSKRQLKTNDALPSGIFILQFTFPDGEKTVKRMVRMESR